MMRMPATPCRRVDGGQDSQTPTPSAKGKEGRMYLLRREPIMPMLTCPHGDKPIAFCSFKSPVPGHTATWVRGKALGSRMRFAAGDVTPQRTVKDDSPPPIAAPVEDEAENATHRMVLWTPPPDDQEGRLEVLVDPDVSRILREHQRIGVQFLYDCLMGLKDFNGNGCILADDMGLGKTLQSVSIVWTLLTQGGPRGKPACKKALVVCPASLVKNWAGEFDKWLKGRCKYTAIAESGQAKVAASIQFFRYSSEHKVLIASYETFRGHAAEAAECDIDLVVCDEAHKLKNEDSATTKCIAELKALVPYGSP